MRRFYFNICPASINLFIDNFLDCYDVFFPENNFGLIQIFGSLWTKLTIKDFF